MSDALDPAGPTPRLLGRGMTLADQLARHASTQPEHLALTCEDSSLTYAELDTRVSRLANALHERGADPGDRIAVLGGNRIEVLEVYFACARLGAICVPVNFRSAADEIAYVLADSGARAAIVQASLAPTLDKARGQLGTDLPRLVFGNERGDYERALREAAPDFAERTVSEHEAAFIMYTSGTTGRPKGAVLTHLNLLMHAFSNMAHLGVSPDDRVWLAAAPLFHIAGLSGLLPTILLGGRVVVLPSGRFDPAAALDVLERERVTSCSFVPAQWQAICAVPGIGDRDLSALRRITWGAAPASTTLLRTMIDTFPQAEVSTAFGQTECSPVTTVLRGADSIRKIGSVGTPMLNVEVRVVDENMRDVPQGEVGEIVYRGPTVMREYWGKPAETAEVFRGGWFHSGDLVRADADGYLYVVDRKKDMIISGGENIYCAEVEDVLAGHPDITEVALIGVPDEKWGEVPLAVLVLREGAEPPHADDLRTWCADRLARYKQPRRIAILAALPRNASGKVLKTDLRADLATGRLETGTS